MQALLEGLLPRLFPALSFLCVPHSGKTDLERSLRGTLRNWNVPGDRFVIVRDNDNSDCVAVKQRLRSLCREGRREDTLIRIVCQELEAWYLGDPGAMAVAFGDDRLNSISNQARYRDPDTLDHPSRIVTNLVDGYGKVSGARLMAQHLSPERNRSHSFSVFLTGIERLSHV